MNNKLLEKLKEIFTPDIEKMGYELVDIEFSNEDGDNYLTFYIYNENGIGLQDCEKVSKYIDPKIEEHDYVKGSYFLQVSSPDLSRPLKTDSDLKRNLEQELTVNLYKKINNKKNYEGYLVDYNEKIIKLLQSNDEIIELDRSDISLIKILLRF